jgi:hypothetical protein
MTSRDAVEMFKRRYYRQTTQWNRPPKPTVCTIPDDYDQVLVIVQALLGHKSPKTTARYAEVSVEKLVTAVQRMERGWNEGGSATERGKAVAS